MHFHICIIGTQSKKTLHINSCFVFFIATARDKSCTQVGSMVIALFQPTNDVYKMSMTLFYLFIVS